MADLLMCVSVSVRYCCNVTLSASFCVTLSWFTLGSFSPEKKTNNNNDDDDKVYHAVQQ